MANGQWTEIARGRPRHVDSTNWQQAYPHSWVGNAHSNRPRSLENILEVSQKERESAVVVAYNGFGWDVVYAGFMSEVLPKDGEPIDSSLPPYGAIESNGLSAYDWVRAGDRGTRLLGHTSDGHEFPTHIPDMSAAEITRLHQKYIEPGFYHNSGPRQTEFTHPSSDGKMVPIEQMVPAEALSRLKEAYRNGEPVAISIDPKTGSWKEMEDYNRGSDFYPTISAQDIPKRALNEKPGQAQVAAPVQLPPVPRKEPTAGRDGQGTPANPQAQPGDGVAESPPMQAQIFDSAPLSPVQRAEYPAGQQEERAGDGAAVANEGANASEPGQEGDSSKKGLKEILSNLSTGQKAAIAGAAAAVLAIVGAAASARMNPGDAPGRPTGQNPQNRGRY